MTEFEIIKKMIERIADRKVKVECIGSYQTIIIDYVVLEFEDGKFTDTWADIDEYWEISHTKDRRKRLSFLL